MRNTPAHPASPMPSPDCRSARPLAIALAALLAWGSLPSRADAQLVGQGLALASAGSGTVGASSTARTRPGRSRPPVAQRSSSEETPAERDRRLSRECRGRPNAGACLGYARP